jgi:two-component system, LytTR family, response regulator
MRDRTLRVVVVEDEGAARAGLIRMLAQEPDVEVVGEAGDVDAAVSCLAATCPDAVLLDIQLPSGSGFDVLRRLDTMPKVVFTTAHHRHAVAAFELAALDYLLKPFTAERLRVALDRLRHVMERDEPDDTNRVQTARDVMTSADPLDRLYVRRGRRIVMLPVVDIHRIEADGMYTRIVTARDVHVAVVPLAALLPRLPTSLFLRVHRSHIVNLQAVTGFTVLPSGRLQVEMLQGPAIPCSREYAREIRQRSF